MGDIYIWACVHADVANKVIYIWACVHADVANKVIYIWDMPLFISVRGGPGLAPVSHYSPNSWIWETTTNEHARTSTQTNPALVMHAGRPSRTSQCHFNDAAKS